MSLGDPRDWGDWTCGPFDTLEEERQARRERTRRLFEIWLKDQMTHKEMERRNTERWEKMKEWDYIEKSQ